MSEPEATARHVLLRRLAEGGMGELFLARAQAAGGVQRLVVLKRIREVLGDDPEFVQMFLNECRLAATLQHPNIVTVYDVGHAQGRYYYSMEYIHGEPLSRILGAAERRKGLPLSHALTIVLGITAGIAHAHQQRGLDGAPLCIIHRDLSPSNVLVTYEGVVKIVDFGLARAVALTRVTPHGVRKGKAAYMSPEQAAGQELDGRSDVFSIGVLLYELTTLKRAFRGQTLFELINRVAAGRITPPSERVAGYPAALEAIVMRALAPDPRHRYRSARELHRALEAFAAEQGLSLSTMELGEFIVSLLGERPHPTTTEVDLPQLVAGRTEVERVTAPPTPSAPPRWPRWLAAGVVVLGVVGLGVLWSGADEPSASPPDASGPAAASSPSAPAPAPAPAPPSVEVADAEVDPEPATVEASGPALDLPGQPAPARSSKRSRRRASRSSRPAPRRTPRPPSSSASDLLPGD